MTIAILVERDALLRDIEFERAAARKLASEKLHLEVEVLQLRERMDTARKLGCFAANPVCRCCVEIVDALFPEPDQYDPNATALPPEEVTRGATHILPTKLMTEPSEGKDP